MGRLTIWVNGGGQHEVRELRSEAQRLDEEFSALCAKWRNALPDGDVLLAACTAAKQKAVTSRVEQVNARLKDELLQQQLYYSALQQKLTEAPLWPRSALCQELFDRLHGHLYLKADPETRKKQLNARFELGLRLAPGLVESFTREFVPLTSPVLPFSRTSTSATTIVPPSAGQNGSARFSSSSTCGTLVSNVFVCKIPASANIPRIFQALVENQRISSTELERRLGVLLQVKNELVLGPFANYARVQRQDGDMRGAHTNRAFTGQLMSNDLAVLVTDFVDQDDDEEADDDAKEAEEEAQVGSDGVPVLSPSPPTSSIRIDICCLVTVARVLDPETQEPVVLLRRLRVHRYNLPPNAPALHRELNKLLSYFNGDFHMAMLSDAFQTRLNGDELSVAVVAASGGYCDQPVKEERQPPPTEGQQDGGASSKKRKTRPGKEQQGPAQEESSEPPSAGSSSRI
ncbi:hypothetical protein BBJ28_00000895 [Nothophytophthora sp. Chile5]|nr:hypothetical protein BBJ28_00000895 [Nothophytophthora sp. Chile5]